jgi:hypothetical protein
MQEEQDAFAELEEMLFGITRERKKEELYIQDRDFVPLKTGQPGYKIMKYGPKHILNAD